MRLDDDDPEGDALLSNNRTIERHLFPRFGARCDNALPAAIFDARLVLGFLSTLDAALAARRLVRRCLAMNDPFLLSIS